jgi:hypothetical protein
MKTRMRRVALSTVLAVAVAAAGAVPGASASEPASAHDGAVAVQRLHDELAEAVRADDVPAVRWALGELTPLLADLRTDGRYAIEDGTREVVANRSAEASTVKEQIDTLLAERDLPSIPELLNMLLQKLLELLSDLFDNLLGGGVPLPAKPPNP